MPHCLKQLNHNILYQFETMNHVEKIKNSFQKILARNRPIFNFLGKKLEKYVDFFRIAPLGN